MNVFLNIKLIARNWWRNKLFFLISLFSLTAIRKVNGAGLKQIILLFARLYIKLLTVSAIIAFPLIYIVIQIWKKAYIVFFNDGIIYWAGIFIGITFITALTVLFRILGIARINPAKVIKNE